MFPVISLKIILGFIKSQVELKNEPSIVVFKDDTYYQLSPKVKTADGIKLWVLIERLPSYLILEG